MIIDPIADMLTRIRNAQMVRISQVQMPASKFKAAILAVLKNSKYIKDFKIKDQIICVDLAYPNNKPQIIKVKKVSKPGLRIYTSSKKIPKVLQGFGTVIMSTSSGVMTGEEARKKNLGGEVICELY